MRASPRAILAAYLLVMFATLPLLPPLVTLVRNRLGTSAFSGVLYAVLAAFFLPPLWRLAAPPRPRPPWPHLSFFLLVLFSATVLGSLVSSPVGRVHLVEYGLLAVLILRALPWKPGAVPFLAAFAAAAAIGLADETVQHFLPNRVFDWYDVGLNFAAALLGLLAAAWWTWTSPGREGTLFPEGGPECE
jgi:VanZ family protein